ncbi:LytR C-terminal domain-containing protein [Rhodococcus sp. NPDC047139]|uniref:LytR C-terminal domain-containing protein n=1 Tax=Rhodococcus sp. NPDC047139 TaxID=3155141 RepID=UPI0033DDA38D
MVEVVSRTPESPNRAPASSGPPLRAFAMVLISLGILFAGLGFASLGGSDDDAAPSAAPTTTSAAPAAPGAQSAASPATGAGRAPTSGPAASATSAAELSPATVTTTADVVDSAAATAAPVRVLNNSEVAGLAAQTATFLEDEGFTVSETGNYSEGLLAQTSVFYGTSPGEQQTATAVAEALGVSAQPRFEGLQNAAPGVIVIVTSR